MSKIMTHSDFTTIARAAAGARREREEQALVDIRTSWHAQLERAAENHSGSWLQLDSVSDHPRALYLHVLREYRDAGWEVREHDFAVKLPGVIA